MKIKNSLENMESKTYLQNIPRLIHSTSLNFEEVKDAFSVIR